MGVFSIFTRRVRGVRVVDLAATMVLLVLAVSSYAFKTMAEAQGAGAADIQTQIDKEQRRVRLLKAEIAHLESPGRIETLASQVGMVAVDPHHEIEEGDLARIAVAPPPVPPVQKAKS